MPYGRLRLHNPSLAEMYTLIDSRLRRDVKHPVCLVGSVKIGRKQTTENGVFYHLKSFSIAGFYTIQ